VTPAPELTPRQVRAVAALLEADTREQAATSVGVSDRTLRRWLQLPPFAAEMRRQRTQALDRVATILTAGAAACARALVDIATKGGSKRDAVRVSAARAVLDAAARAEELSTLTARLGELEAQVASQAGKPGGRQWQ
jgi:hypothetical protein